MMIASARLAVLDNLKADDVFIGFPCYNIILYLILFVAPTGCLFKRSFLDGSFFEKLTRITTHGTVTVAASGSMYLT